MDTQDVAKFCLRALQIPKTTNRTFLLNGSRGWISSEVINLCEQLAGQEARIQRIPIFVLEFISYFFGFFSWSQSISDRLAFAKILNNKNDFYDLNLSTYQIFKMDFSEIIQLDEYFLEYFLRLLKRLRDINFEDIQKQKNLII